MAKKHLLGKFKSTNKTTKTLLNSKAKRRVKTVNTIKANKKKSISPKKSGDIYISKNQLDAVEASLTKQITSLRLDTKAGFAKMDARFADMESRFSSVDARFADMESRFSSIDARFSSIEAKFSKIDARFDSLESKFASMDSKLSQMLALMEDQRSQNRFVLDGYTSLYDRQNLAEKRIEDIEKIVLGKEQI